MAEKTARERMIEHLEKIFDLQKRMRDLNNKITELSSWIEHSDDKYLSEFVNPKFYNSKYPIGRDITETDVKLFNRTLSFVKEFIDAIKERHKQKSEELKELSLENDRLCGLVELDPDYCYPATIYILMKLLKEEKAKTLEEAIEIFDDSPNWADLI